MKPVSLDNTVLFYLAIALSIAPIWLVQYLPMVDLPQHVGQVTALREWLAGNPVFVQEFEINWFTPYLLAYLLLYALSSVVALPMATKVLISFAVAAIPVLTGALLREVGGDQRLRWLVIPGAISFAFYWGFLSFMCAVPIALYLMLCAIRYEKDPTVIRALGIATLSVLLFFAHVLALGMACLASLAYIFSVRRHKPWTHVGLWLPFTASVPLILAWLVLTFQQETFVQDAPVVYGNLSHRFAQLFNQPTGIDFYVSTLTPLIALILYLAPLYLRCTLTRDYRRWALFITGLTVYFLFPAYALRTALLYERFGIFLLPLWLLLWDRSSVKTARIHWLPIATIALIAVFNIARFSLFNNETRDFTRTIAAIEPGSRVASVVQKKKSKYFHNFVYLHHVVWYQSIGKGIVDFNFGFFYPQLVRFRDGHQTAIDEQFAWVPFSYTWDRYDGNRYDYFLMHAEKDVAQKLFHERTLSVPLVERNGNWWLYRNAKNAVPE